MSAFEGQLDRTKHLPRYTFYDGPPFATGLPHYGHILAGTIKVSLSFLQENFEVWLLNTQTDLKSTSGIRYKKIILFTDKCFTQLSYRML
jgi:hypothetical protein